MYIRHIKTITLLLSILYLHKLSAQEQLGLRLDNYSGVSSIMHNPASSATHQLVWDINIVSMGSWMQNNLGYIQKGTVPKLINNTDKIGPHPSLGLKSSDKNTLLFNVAERSKYYATIGTNTMGPSFLINLKNGHSFGLFSNFRFHLSSYNLPKLLNPKEMNAIYFNQQFTVDAFKLGGMAWAEVGANYAYTIARNTEGVLVVGANFKYLQGFQALFIKNKGGTALNQVSRDTFKVDVLRATIGYTTSFDSDPATPTGRGFGLDLGAVLTTGGSDKRPYTWRFSAALTDIGGIRYSKNATVNFFQTTESFQIEKKDYDTAIIASAIANNIMSKASPQNQQRTVADAFTMGLPSALQVQADYAIADNIYLNGYAILRFPISKNALQRDNLLALTPRYESRWLGAAMPISVINGKQMRVGLSGRLAFLTLGTDHLFSYLIPHNLRGTDFYMSLKINPFHLSFLGQNTEGEGKWGKKKKVSCYRFR
jgi:hypothetical protein